MTIHIIIPVLNDLQKTKNIISCIRKQVIKEKIEIIVINDGSTADKWSGHGTHVSCTVLGDGFRGGYAGVAPEAQLYFQAMENDDENDECVILCVCQ